LAEHLSAFFEVKQGESRSAAAVGGSIPADALNFIQQVINNLIADSGGQTFDNDLDPKAMEAALFQTEFK
jgi:hypothetical protein